MAEPAIASSKDQKRRSLLGIFFVLLVVAGAAVLGYLGFI